MGVKSTREAAVRALMELAEVDRRIVVVSPDAMLAGRLLPFCDRFPDRFLEIGIAEQASVDIAAGLATAGLTPVVVSYAGFLTMRACEMIRTFVSYPGLNVKLIGLNGGMLGGEREGVTHQFYEDVGILRAMPGVAILTPADAGQAYQAAKAMMAFDGPVYLRLGSGREPEVFDEDVPFQIGKLRIVKEYGSDVAVFASGFIMNRALEALERLKGNGVYGILADVSTAKPIDSKGVAEILKRTDCAVAIEDHNVYGGMSSAICEVACQEHPCRVIRLGLRDEYPRSGHAAELLDAYGLSVDAMIAGALKAMSK